MATWYVNAAETYDGDGTTTGSAATAGAVGAFNNLQTAIVSVAAGDTVYATGTQVLTSGGTAVIAINATSSVTGTDTANINLIGVNGSWVDDGTKFIIDGNNANLADGLTFGGVEFWNVDNIRVTRASYYGLDWDSAYGRYCQFENCEFDRNGWSGAELQYAANSVFIRCIFHSNSARGAYNVSTTTYFVGCVFANNSSQGYYYGGGVLYGCQVYDNATEGFYNTGQATVINTVIDGNTEGAQCDTSVLLLIGTRITNNTTGIVSSDTGDANFALWCHFAGNTNKTSGTGALLEHENTNTSSDGYTSATDYNLTSSADLRRTSIALPTASAAL